MGNKIVATFKHFMLWLFTGFLIVFVLLPLLPFYILYLLAWGLLDVLDVAITDTKEEKNSE